MPHFLMQAQDKSVLFGFIPGRCDVADEFEHRANDTRLVFDVSANQGLLGLRLHSVAINNNLTTYINISIMKGRR